MIRFEDRPASCTTSLFEKREVRDHIERERFHIGYNHFMVAFSIRAHYVETNYFIATCHYSNGVFVLADN